MSAGGDGGRPFYMAFQGFKLNPACNYGVTPTLSGLTARITSMALSPPVLGVYHSLSGEADIVVWAASQDTRELYKTRTALKSEAARVCGAESFYWLSLYKPSPYHPSPPAEEILERLRRGRRLRYLVFYPMKKSPEWYLIPVEERRRIMAEHIAIAKRETAKAKGEIRSYTTYTFGLAGWEFIVVYEVDDLAEWVRIVEELRRAEARKWVTHESPVIVGEHISQY
ncbi:MAG: chlorite dismutase family protein [Desulfurococcales archaeon]|nr:chlorite dismutase family protein [Desulfurococcales archaeon]